MENENNKPSNGAALTSTGESVAKGASQGQDPKVREGQGNEGRPEYGAEGGANTSSREDQLPTLNNGSSPGAEADRNDNLDDEKAGSDADHDQGGNPSI